MKKKMWQYRFVFLSDRVEIYITRGLFRTAVRTRSYKVAVRMLFEAVANGHRVEHFLVQPYVTLAKR